jgi:homoserine dehydrogenase
VAAIDAVRVALLGFGDVAQALAHRLAGGSPGVRITAAVDRGGAVVDPDGLAPTRLLEKKADAGTVAEAPGRTRDWTSLAAARRSPADVVVQLTPSDLDDPQRGADELVAALEAGRHAVTAAKDGLACRPQRVRSAAADGARLRCGAAVAASTPVLEVLGTAFEGDRLRHLQGVLNGSTTAILSRWEDGDGYGEALEAAREDGLLEADPAADLLGHDAAAKAAILHQEAYGSRLAYDAVEAEGVTDLDPSAVRARVDRGYATRLLARVDADGARVRPVTLPRSSPLVVDGPRAAVRLVLEEAGEVALAGPGAGPRETAGAVLDDVLAAGGGTGAEAGVRRTPVPTRA